MGYPVLSVEAETTQDTSQTILKISQKKFSGDGSEDSKNSLWAVPISLVTSKVCFWVMLLFLVCWGVWLRSQQVSCPPPEITVKERQKNQKGPSPSITVGVLGWGANYVCQLCLSHFPLIHQQCVMGSLPFLKWGGTNLLATTTH